MKYLQGPLRQLCVLELFKKCDQEKKKTDQVRKTFFILQKREKRSNFCNLQRCQQLWLCSGSRIT